MAGPSHFAEVTSVTWTPVTFSTASSSASAIAIYSVNSIDIRQHAGVVYGADNNKKRAVSAHTATFQESVSVNTNDIGAMKSLEAYKGTAGKLTFTWKASSNQLNSSALADQTVTIYQVLLEDVSPTAASKGLGSGALQGVVCELPDGSDPITYT